jgi:hypothetical protein
MIPATGARDGGAACVASACASIAMRLGKDLPHTPHTSVDEAAAGASAQTAIHTSNMSQYEGFGDTCERKMLHELWINKYTI